MTGARSGDYHVHSRFSDGADELDAYCERALESGLSELGFAEHLTPAALADEGCCSARRLEEYGAAVRACAARHPELRVLCGIEADYVPESAAETLAALAAHPFDYVLCAVHFVDGFSIDEARFLRAAGWQDVDRVWRRYYETLTEAVRSGAFDAVAHLDLPKTWDLHPSEEMGHLEDDALAAIAAAGMAIEVNTSGLARHPVGEIYPSHNLLRRAGAANIAIVLGSDAHCAADVGARFAEAEAWARAAGYESWLRLSDRSPQPFPRTASGEPLG